MASLAGLLPASRALALLLLLLLLLAPAPALSADGGATTSAEKDVPDWASNNALQLTLSTKPGLQFTTIPLTENLGLNESERTRGVVSIDGFLRPANVSNYNQIGAPDDVVYLSCDKPGGDNFITPDKMLNDLMARRPKAILLFSTSRNWCSLSSEDPLSFTSILTMADAGEASNVLSYLGGNGGNNVRALIQGNTTEDQAVNDPGGGGGNNSAVAMSILYSITGLITLLFLIIIATGAIRAHRYPERYGPRGAFGGRPRQSRAKGLARAVLDTIPIVKFGNQQPAKPDPQLELETATTDGHDATTLATSNDNSNDTSGPPAGRRANAKTPAATTAAPTGTTTTSTSRQPESRGSAAPAPSAQPADDAQAGGDGHLGCSICTEDFKVGEDVRVLPCNHQYHPNCVDPWLVNVSGTCPLCRLDLRPGQDGPDGGTAAEDDDSLAPPLALEDEGHGQAGPSHGNRLSRLLDINRLRQAPVEERMEALRQMRAQSNEHEADEAPAAAERPPQGARLTDKLKDKFRIRTRAQSADRRDG